MGRCLWLPAQLASVSFFLFFLSTVLRILRQPERRRQEGRQAVAGPVGTALSCESLLQGAQGFERRCRFVQRAVGVPFDTATAWCCANSNFQLEVNVAPAFAFGQRCR